MCGNQACRTKTTWLCLSFEQKSAKFAKRDYSLERKQPTHPTWSQASIPEWQKYTLGAQAVRKIPEGYVIIEMYTTSRNERHKYGRPNVAIFNSITIQLISIKLRCYVCSSTIQISKYSFNYSFSYSTIHSAIQLFIQLFNYSFSYSTIHSTIQLFIQLFNYSFSYSTIYSAIQLFIQLFNYSFNYSFSYSIIHSTIQLFIQLSNYSFSYSTIHSTISCLK